MTAVCGGGTSVPKVGTAASMVVDRAYIQSILPPALAWLYPYLPYMRGLEIGNVGDFCSVDPPTLLSMPTGAEWLSFATNFLSQSYESVNDFLVRLTEYYLWYSICQCSVGSPTAPSSPPTAPSDLPAINPPAAVQPNLAQPCSIQTWTHLVPPNIWWSYPSSVFTLPGGATRVPVAGAPGDIIQIVSRAVLGTAPDPTHTMFDFRFYRADGGFISSVTTNVTINGTGQITVPATASTWELIYNLQPGGVGTDNTMTYTINQYCNGQTPTSVASQCCPPDPALGAALSRVEQLVTLLQRQMSPFAFIEGDVHSGLTGEGEIAISSLVGVRVDVIDSLPGTVGVTTGHPETLHGAGWVRWGDVNGWRERVYLDTVSVVSTPYAAGAMTKIGYSLPDGAEVDITELEREP